MKNRASNLKSASLVIRRLHLYLGLFISPFILVYAVSTIFLNHGVRPSPSDTGKETAPISVEAGLEGMPLIHEVLRQLDLSGEILGQGAVRNGKTAFRIARPGTIKIVEVDLEAGQATVTSRSSGMLGALVFLHFNPGLHKPPNWAITKFWGWLADAVVYLTLFLTVSGIYMWALIKAERKSGLIAVGLGGLSFGLILAALISV